MGNSNHISEVSNVETIGTKNGKYLVKFPFLDIPVEVGENYYKTFLQN